MVQHDVIFDQHYSQKVSKMYDHAFQHGRYQGMNDVLAILGKMSESGKKLVNVEAVLLQLHANRATENTAINEASLKADRVVDVETPKERPKFELVK